jgi:hypothetical protein
MTPTTQRGPRKKTPVDAALLRANLSYDAESGALTWLRKASYRVNVGDVAGVVHRATGYILVGLLGGRYYAHRLAWLHSYGEWPCGLLDHINGDKVDNRICNLRQVSYSENAQNTRTPHADNRCATLGVCRSQGKYMARIKLNGVVTNLGRFDTLAEASQAYVTAKMQIHPAFDPPHRHPEGVWEETGL